MYYDLERSGAVIRQLRKENGYTQEGLAKALNIDRSFYSRIESGKTGCSVDLFIQLSMVFNVSLDYLILGKVNGTLFWNVERSILKKEAETLKLHLDQFLNMI